MKLPGWPPKDWRAILALLASIAGAAVMTGLLAWLIYIFWTWQAVDPLAKIAFGLLALIGVSHVSLGLAINRRSVKASAFGATLEASGGEDEE